MVLTTYHQSRHVRNVSAMLTKHYQTIKSSPVDGHVRQTAAIQAVYIYNPAMTRTGLSTSALVSPAKLPHAAQPIVAYVALCCVCSAVIHHNRATRMRQTWRASRAGNGRDPAEVAQPAAGASGGWWRGNGAPMGGRWSSRLVCASVPRSPRSPGNNKGVYLEAASCSSAVLECIV